MVLLLLEYVFSVRMAKKAKDHVFRPLALYLLGGSSCLTLHTNIVRERLHRTLHGLQDAPNEGSQNHEGGDEQDVPDRILSVFGHCISLVRFHYSPRFSCEKKEKACVRPSP